MWEQLQLGGSIALVEACRVVTGAGLSALAFRVSGLRV